MELTMNMSGKKFLNALGEPCVIAYDCSQIPEIPDYPERNYYIVHVKSGNVSFAEIIDNLTPITDEEYLKLV